MTEKLEFTAEGIRDGFYGNSVIATRLKEEGCDPEDLAEFLNETFDQDDMRSMDAMFEDHGIELEIGGAAFLREINSFGDWKDEVEYDSEEES